MRLKVTLIAGPASSGPAEGPRLAPGQFIRFRILPGQYEFEVRAIPFLGSPDVQSESGVVLDCQPRAIYCLVIEPLSAKGLLIQRSSD